MLAEIVDGSLYGCFALTVALIVYKAYEMYVGAGRALGRGDFVNNEVQLEEGIEKLESCLVLLATIASTAPFIGLGGTVLHIMEALASLSGAAMDIRLISGPIATALNSTLLGLASAIPAAAAYNLFLSRIQKVENRVRRMLEAAQNA